MEDTAEIICCGCKLPCEVVRVTEETVAGRCHNPECVYSLEYQPPLVHRLTSTPTPAVATSLLCAEGGG